MRSILLLGVGGFCGSVARYGVQCLFGNHTHSAFPIGTFIVNISGCLLIGIFFGLSSRFNWFNQDLHFLFITGLCGGYTTFSTFSYDGISLIRNGNYFIFFSYLVLSFFVGLLFTYIGLLISK